MSNLHLRAAYERCHRQMRPLISGGIVLRVMAPSVIRACALRCCHLQQFSFLGFHLCCFLFGLACDYKHLQWKRADQRELLNVLQVLLFKAGSDYSSYFVKRLYYFLLSVVMYKYNITSFIRWGGGGERMWWSYVLSLQTKIVFVFWLHYENERSLVLWCLLLILLDGVYWVQVVMECLVIAFCTACHHQYATMELNTIKLTPGIEVNSLEKQWYLLFNSESVAPASDIEY